MTEVICFEDQEEHRARDQHECPSNNRPPVTCIPAAGSRQAWHETTSERLCFRHAIVVPHRWSTSERLCFTDACGRGH